MSMRRPSNHLLPTRAASLREFELELDVRVGDAICDFRRELRVAGREEDVDGVRDADAAHVKILTEGRKHELRATAIGPLALRLRNSPRRQIVA